MHRLGIPPYLVKWYRGFLIDRRYRVKYGSDVSKVARFPLGVPQGSISVPLLFIIYLSTLTKKIGRLNEPTIKHGEYADDLSIWARVRKQADGSYNMKPLQRTLDVISRWSHIYGINVSAAKSVGVLFFKDPRGWFDAGMELTYRESPIPWQRTGKALGILIDNTIGFTPHCNEVIAKVRRKLPLINKISGKKWSSSTRDMRAACLSQVMPILTYGSSVWGPLISPGTRDKLQLTVNLMARIITGTCRATNTSSLLVEANLDQIDRYIDDRTMAAVKRTRRRHRSDPLHNKSMGPTPTVRKTKKFKVQCWQQRSDLIQAQHKIRFQRRSRNKRTGQLTKLPSVRVNALTIAQAKINITSYSPLFDYRTNVAPHKAKSLKLRLYPDLLEPVNSDTPVADKKRIAESTIDRLRQRGATWELLLDASVIDGKGVGVAHFYTGPPPATAFNPVTRQWAAPDTRKWETFALAGEGVHSSTAESIALKAGLLKLTKQLRPAPTDKRLIIATDCLSLVLALEKGPIKQKDPTLAQIWRSLYKLFDRGIARIAIQWIPSHCGIQRNEFADARAKTLLSNCSAFSMRRVPMLYSAAVSYYKDKNRQYYQNQLIAEETERSEITTAKANLRVGDKLTRTQQSTLAQLRSGTCTSMGWYVGYCRSGYDPNHKNDVCRWCGVAPESVLHVFNDCDDLQLSQLRAEYRAATNKTFSASTLCTDQLAALEFHASAIIVLGAAGGGL